MDTLCGFPYIFSSLEPHLRVDPADHQGTLFLFNLSYDLSRQSATAGIDMARFQRTSKGTNHSTCGRSNHIVESRGMRFAQLCGVHLVVFRDGAVDAEENGVRFARQFGNAQRPHATFNVNMRGVHDIAHGSLRFRKDSGGASSRTRSTCAGSPRARVGDPVAVPASPTLAAPVSAGSKQYCYTPGKTIDPGS